MIKLSVFAGPDKGQIYHLHEGCPLLFGRSRHADCQLKATSRVHCEIELKSGRVGITDLDSNSGIELTMKLI